jgi:hypothetical protein
MNRNRCLFAAALSLSLLSTSALAAENRTLIMGVWPNELRLLDEGTEKVVGQIQLRYGAVTGYGRTPHTPDFKRLYYITDRMEAVEVVDPAALRVIDELRLSTAGRRVRILGVYPHPGGTELILRVVATGMDIDRFEAEDAEYVVYDLNTHQVKDDFRLPSEVRTDFTDPFPFSADGTTFFAFGRDVYELSASTHEVVSKIPLAARRAPGYGGLRPADLYSTEPGIYYGLVSTTDPFLRKEMTGVLQIDLERKTTSSFEIGPKVDANVFALSPDGKTGYAGLKDLVKIDMESHRITAMKKGFLQGRAATVLIVSGDGTKLFVTGIGDAIQVVDAESLEVKRTIQLGRDLMANPLPLPARPGASSASR